jgi:hypothetical protein
MPGDTLGRTQHSRRLLDTGSPTDVGRNQTETLPAVARNVGQFVGKNAGIAQIPTISRRVGGRPLRLRKVGRKTGRASNEEHGRQQGAGGPGTSIRRMTDYGIAGGPSSERSNSFYPDHVIR